jgi:hypothetical protein
VEESEFRAIWSTLGGALFATGFVVGSDWIFAVSGSAPSRHLSYNNPALYISAVIALLGIAIFVAALVDRLWLPGKARIHKVAKIRDDVQTFLARFLAIGNLHLLSNSTSIENYKTWTTNLREFAEEAFGTHEMALLIPGPSTSITAQFNTVCNGIQSLIVRGRQVPLRRDFDPSKSPDSSWQEFIHADEKFP